MAFDSLEAVATTNRRLEKTRRLRGVSIVAPVSVDVSKFELATTLAGQEFALPVGIAPTGAAGILRHDGDRELARAAAGGECAFRHVRQQQRFAGKEAAAVRGAHLVPAVRPQGLVGDSRQGATGGRSGIKALVLSVDVPVSSNRERNRRSGFSALVARDALNGAVGSDHPGWTFGNTSATAGCRP